MDKAEQYSLRTDRSLSFLGIQKIKITTPKLLFVNILCYVQESSFNHDNVTVSLQGSKHREASLFSTASLSSYSLSLL